MNWKNQALEKIIYPLSSAVSRQKAWKYYNYYLDYARKDLEQRRAEQWKKVKNVLNHAYENVDFYRKKFENAGIKPEDINTWDDFRKIPITTKAELRENFPNSLIADNYQDKIRFTNTSGTTERPTTLAQDRKDVNFKYAAKLRSRNLYGGNLDYSVLRLTPNRCQPVRRNRSSFTGISDYLAEGIKDPRNAFYAALEETVSKAFHDKETLRPIGEENTNISKKEFLFRIKQIKKYCPEILTIYPLYCFWIARFMERNDIDPPDLDIIDLTGGLSTEKMRNYIEEVFETKTFQSYGGCEFGRYGAECRANHNLMHILEEHCYVEFIRPDGKKAHEKEVGNIITTSLTNYGMPLIRVEHGDIGCYKTENCTCGRTSKLMKVKGRLQSVIYGPRDEIVTPDEIYDVLLRFPGVEYFQFMQKNEKSFILRLIERDKGSINKNLLKRKISQLFSGKIEVEIELKKYIESENSNKYMLVKSSTYNSFRPKDVRDKKSEIN